MQTLTRSASARGEAGTRIGISRSLDTPDIVSTQFLCVDRLDPHVPQDPSHVRLGTQLEPD
jgi:hypothetical protein